MASSESSEYSMVNPNPNPNEEMGWEEAWSARKVGRGVMLEGYVEASMEGGNGGSDGGGGDGVVVAGRTKSLTDEDLEDLKGCLDLGFGFSYDEIPELCNTLPALELCYSMSQRFILDEQQQHNNNNRSVDHQLPAAASAAAESTVSSSSSSSSTQPIANWRISSPGDHPDDVKARLKYWAQAVACTVRLCS